MDPKQYCLDFAKLTLAAVFALRQASGSDEPTFANCIPISRCPSAEYGLAMWTLTDNLAHHMPF